MPTMLHERRKPSKMVVWRATARLLFSAAFRFMTRHSPERRKQFRQALTSVQDERRRQERIGYRR